MRNINKIYNIPPVKRNPKPLDKTHKQTIYNIMVRDYEDSLIEKMPNEFKNSLRDYNHRNQGEFKGIDTNSYDIYD